MLYDGHTHLNDDKLYDNRIEILKNFEGIGGKGLVNIGVSGIFNQRAIEIAKKCENMDMIVKATIGLHPEETINWNLTKANFKNQFDDMKRLYKGNEKYIVGIGECGIDYHYEGSLENAALQKELFAISCDFAQEVDLPLVVHSRDGFDDTIDVLSIYKNMRIYFHCRGYGQNELKTILDMFPDCYIGFAGNVTYPKAVNIKETQQYCPQQKIILETDAPYLAPQKLRGKTNEPAFVKEIYDFTAQNLGMQKDYLENLIEDNFKRLYNL